MAFSQATESDEVTQPIPPTPPSSPARSTQTPLQTQANVSTGTNEASTSMSSDVANPDSDECEPRYLEATLDEILND